jgi:pimeloyl-ACP methyl ester carboxylesterase
VKRGLVGSALGLAAAAAGAAVVADRRVVARRRRARAAQDEFAEPLAARSGFLRADDGVALYYEEDGPPDAPVSVVLAHGFCLDHNDFLFQRRALLERYGDAVRLISYDQRSHGRSGRCASDRATIDQLGADLLLLIETLAPAGRLVLIGHSMGGMTIMALADAHPELFGDGGRVSGVALLSTTTGKLATVSLGLPAALARLRGPILPLLLRGASRTPELVERGRARTSDFAWIFLRRLAFGSDVDPALVEFLSAMIAHTRVDVIADFYPTLMDHDKLSALDVLTHTPVFVICGERDVLTPPEHSRAMADALPSAELVLVPDAGHQALMERPDVVNVPLMTLVDTALAEARPRRRTRRVRT